MGHVTEEMRVMFSYLNSGELLWVNWFGEPFFSDGQVVVKVSPENGESENVGPTKSFNPATLDDYFSGESLKQGWVAEKGAIPEGFRLVPVLPFSVGGEFSVANLMSVPLEEGVRYYQLLREKLRDLPDGATFTFEVIE